MRLPLLALLFACSTTNPGHASDSHVGDSVGADGAPRGVTITDVQCVTSTLTEVAIDGSKVVSNYQHAEIAYDTSTVVEVEQCDETINGKPLFTPPLPCPTGNVCTASGAAIPTWMPVCVFSSPTLVNGMIEVFCGQSAVSFDGSGQQNGSSSTTFSAVRLHVH